MQYSISNADYNSQAHAYCTRTPPQTPKSTYHFPTCKHFVLCFLHCTQLFVKMLQSACCGFPNLPHLLLSVTLPRSPACFLPFTEPFKLKVQILCRALIQGAGFSQTSSMLPHRATDQGPTVSSMTNVVFDFSKSTKGTEIVAMKAPSQLKARFLQHVQLLPQSSSFETYFIVCLSAFFFKPVDLWSKASCSSVYPVNKPP